MAAPQKGKPEKKRKVRSFTDTAGDTEDFDVWVKSRQLLKPDDQLELTEAELSEEISKMLTQTNTNVIHNLVVFNYKDGEFQLVPPACDTVELFAMEGYALHIDSEEARRQIEDEGEMGYPLPPPKLRESEMNLRRVSRASHMDDTRMSSIDAGDGDKDRSQEGDEGDDDEKEEGEGDEFEGEEEEKEGEGDEDEVEDEEGDEGEEGAGEDEEGGDAIAATTGGGKKRKLINQFNYCERAALTFVYPRRNVETQTVQPPRSTYGANVLQWNIFDSYAEDFAQQAKEKEKREEKKGPPIGKTLHVRHPNEIAQYAEELNKKYLKCWQILERMINLNIYDEIANDYRYWEDPADEYRDTEGTLMPLWKFHYERNKKLNITDMIFSPHYYDLFAVCYGTHDFMRQSNEGSVCLFTVKNPSYPDYIIMTESGVMTVDIHPKYPYLIVVGMYDGNVAVYNLHQDYSKPLYMSTGVNSKHSDCVWEVKWGPDMADGEINFYSASSDGRVFNWVLMQNKFCITTIITLYLENAVIEGPDGTEVKLKSCASCMQFHPSDTEIFLIGTEEGYIYKCSIAYSSRYLMTYNAHNLSVYTIDFNRFNSNIFISCSGDWRVKIWEDMRPDPLFIFDLGSAVGDVKWAPFSSTVFAAATTEGKVFVFDLNVNKYKPICSQAIVPKRKTKLTRLTFNNKLPFIIVGDDKGAITSLKLSPNLRLMVKPPKKQMYIDQNVLQIQKLEKLLSLVRELPEGEIIKEVATTVQS